MNFSFNFNRKQLVGLKVLKKVFPKAVNKGLEAGANQLLDWMNEGSPTQTRTPPVLYGNLIESSSVFVGDKLAGVGGRAQGAVPKIGALNPDPLRQYKGKAFVISVIYNSSYAAIMHEWMGNWGPATMARNDAGNKWVEKHLQSDRDALMRTIGMKIKKELGL